MEIQERLQEIADTNEVASKINDLRLDVQSESPLGRLLYKYQDMRIKSLVNDISIKSNLSSKQKDALFDIIGNINSETFDDTISNIKNLMRVA